MACEQLVSCQAELLENVFGVIGRFAVSPVFKLQQFNKHVTAGADSGALLRGIFRGFWFGI